MRDDTGWVVLEQEGDEAEITNGVDWVISTGVRVDPVGRDVLEG